jgi:cytochrome b561
LRLLTEASSTTPEKIDSSDIGYALLGFFVPLAGLILYLLWKDETPLRAKSAGKGALISVIVTAALVILYIIFIMVLVSTVISAAASGL